MRIAFGTDAPCAATEALVAHLVAGGHEVIDCGSGVPWPDAGEAVATAVATGRAELGVVSCFTGTGVSIAANKVAGARAALCTDAATAHGARRWNDANVLAFGLRLTTATVACEMTDAFLAAEVDESERANIAKLR